MSDPMRRRTWILVAAAVLVVLGAVTLIWFQPQKLFYDSTVDEAIPSVSATAEPTTSDETASPAPAVPVELARGTFISREHETTGTARILRLADGQRILRLEGFETSNGPALFVYLSQNPADGEDGLFDDDYLDLGPLKGNIGDQNYVIPAEVDPLGYTSVVVWCDRFSVSFGAADIVAADA
jgi:Electron transfer DM13